jgi:hypothetical protein
MRPWKQAAKIGVVVHGPEVVDSGSALQLINYLKRFGTIKAVLGGTMGRVAVLDAGLESVIAISPWRRPSRSIRDLEPSSDILFLLTQAKSRETSLAFGSMVAKAADTAKPLLLIDCDGKLVAGLAGEADEMAGKIAVDLGLENLEPWPYTGAVHHGDETRRTLTGVMPGELISVNGTVVAKALQSSVEIKAKDGKIVSIKGAELKPHGLEKLPGIDLEKAIVRSGKIRRTLARPRPRLCERRGDGAAFIDHCAEDAFEETQGASVVVTVGDDTTAIAGDILARLGVPVIGLVDGDIDRLAEKTVVLPGSVVIRVEPGYDDLVGKRVKDEIFQGKSWAPLGAKELIEKIIEAAGDHIVQVDRH